MKRPSLEEVKEYFKNAKTVQCICMCDGGSVDITDNIETDIHEFNGGYWIDLESEHYLPKGVKLWGNGHWAKILTYKEKTFSITESQIKELCHSSMYSNTERLKEMFPDAFESEVKLEVGKWYKKDNLLCLIKCIDPEGKIFQRFHCFGFNTPTGYDNFCFDINNGVKHGFLEANISDIRIEVEKNIKQKGFEKGMWISWKDEGVGQIVGTNYWAEIIPTITLSEAEQQLKKKIII